MPSIARRTAGAFSSSTDTNSTLSVASHSITAVYNTDGNFSTSTSGTVTQVVNQASSTTSLASSVNPSVFGQSVTFTATVAAEVAHRLLTGQGRPGTYTPAALFGSSLAEACGGEYLVAEG